MPFFLKVQRFFAAFAFLSVCLISSGWAEGFDHSELNHFLNQYVDAKGYVNYVAAKQNRAELDAYLKIVETTDLSAIDSGPKPEKLAFWINVYHAALLSLILENYPIKSTQEIPSFWDREFLKVGLKNENDKARFSLAQIRNTILLPQFNDEKIHLALALAAKSGPLFPREVYTGPRVLGQLFKRARHEVNRPEMVLIDEDSGQVSISRIFQWYAPDFVKKYGRPQRRAKLSQTDTAVVNFLIRYAQNIKRLKFLKASEFKIEYPSFDWTLNDTNVA